MPAPLLEKLKKWEEFARNAGYRARRLAKVYGVSERHLRRLFERHFGRSPQMMLSEKRMRDALTALRGEHMVKQIASDLHYKHSV